MNIDSLLALPLSSFYFVSVAAATTAVGQGVDLKGNPMGLGASTVINATAGAPVTLSTGIGGAQGGLFQFAADVRVGLLSVGLAAPFTAAQLVTDMTNNPTRYPVLPAGTYKIGALFGNASGI